MTITPFTRRDLIALAMILFVAAFMRFGRADIVEYFHDDGMLATMVQEMADGKAFHLTGINSSTGIPNPPTSVYALLPFFWISRDPVFAIYGIMALNVIGVGLLWVIAHRYFGRVAGIIAGLMYAINPWAVLYSRKLWAQDYHTPFFLLGLVLALYGFMEGDDRPSSRSGRFWAQVAALPILLFAMQIHFAAWALFPLYLMLLWMGRKRIAWRAFVLSAVLGGLMLLPYGIGLAQTLQRDPTRISAALGRTQERKAQTLFVPGYPISLMAGDFLGTWLVPNDEAALPQVGAAGAQFAPVSNIAIAAVLLLGLFVIFLKQRGVMLWILWWAFGPAFLLTSNLTPFYPHYLIASIPGVLLLFGSTWSDLFRSLRKQDYGVAAVPLVIFLALFSLAQIDRWQTALTYLDTHHIPYPGFTTPLHYLLDIRAALKEETDVVVLSDGMAWDLNHEVSVWDTLLYDKTCVRTLRGDGYAVLPDHPFAVLVASNAPTGAVRDLYSGGTPQIFPERPGGGEYKVYHWDAAPEWLTPITDLPTVRFANGVDLMGYEADTSTVRLAWHLPQGQRGENVQYTVQFFDAEGNRVGQGDKVFWQSQHWCAGDTLFTWLDVPRESSAITMRVGLYTLLGEGQYQPIPALNADGQPIGDTIEIKLTTP